MRAMRLPVSELLSKLRQAEERILAWFTPEKALKNMSALLSVVFITNPGFAGVPFFQGNILRILVDFVFLIAAVASLISLYMFVQREYNAYQVKHFQERRRRYMSRERASRRHKPIQHLHKLDGEKVLTKQS